MWYTRLLRRLPDSSCDFVDDYVVVRRVSSQQAADANDGIVLSGFRQLPRCQRNFEGSRHAHEIDVISLSSGAQQPIDRTHQQPLGDEGIEPRYNNGKIPSGGIERSIE